MSEKIREVKDYNGVLRHSELWKGGVTAPQFMFALEAPNEPAVDSDSLPNIDLLMVTYVRLDLLPKPLQDELQNVIKTWSPDTEGRIPHT